MRLLTYFNVSPFMVVIFLMMQKVVPNLWFEQDAQQAVDFYTRIFPDSEILSSTVLHDTPAGDTQIITFSLSGFEFMAFSGRPDFTFNPSISFMVNFDPASNSQAENALDTLWQHLAEDGQVLMPLQASPYRSRYGWLQDKYGLSWQLILPDPDEEERPFLVPSLLFVQG